MDARIMQAHDYIVIGAGSAGCALAARLSEDPATRVLPHFTRAEDQCRGADAFHGAG